MSERQESAEMMKDETGWPAASLENTQTPDLQPADPLYVPSSVSRPAGNSLRIAGKLLLASSNASCAKHSRWYSLM
jgi:hypothetical protein